MKEVLEWSVTIIESCHVVDMWRVLIQYRVWEFCRLNIGVEPAVVTGISIDFVSHLRHMQR